MHSPEDPAYDRGDTLRLESHVELALILATSATRMAAAWIAWRLFRRHQEYRFLMVTFVLAVTAVFPILDVADPPSDFFKSWLPQLGGALAVLLTALILVRTLTDLSQTYEQVRVANDVLEQRVAERTTEIKEANASLESEVAERKRAEQALRASEQALRRNEAELRRLAGKLIVAQEEERRRLARELHDDLTQTLAALALEIANLRAKASPSDPQVAVGLNSIEGTVHRLADSIHDMSRLLHPSILDDLGLAAAIRAECERFAVRESIKVEFETTELPEELPPDCALTLYRVTQEALHNIAKHASAGSASIRLDADNERIALTVSDSGRGFEVDEARGRAGLGLVSMSERVRLIGGILAVDSEPGGGTSVTVRAPVKETVHEQAASVVG